MSMSAERKRMLMQRLNGTNDDHRHVRFRSAFRRTAPAMDTTAYLLASPANARWLLAALEEARTGRIVPLEAIDLDAELGRGATK